MPVKTTIQVRRDTAANWTSTNPILASGEIGLETDTNKTKFGNGSSTWTALSYSASGLKVSDTAPTGATSGDMWLDSTTGKTYTYYDSFWVEQNGANSGKDGYSPAGNAIANGDFSKWTRGISFTNPTLGTYTADRWNTETGGTTGFVVSQQAFTTGTAPVAGYEGQYFARYAATTANAVHGFNQRIDDVRSLAGKTVTFSIWMKAAAATTILVNIDQWYGTGGSGDTFQETTFSVTTSWQRFTWTISLASLAGKTIGTNSYTNVRILNTTNTAFTLDIWGVQLEVGAVATPFKPAGGNTATDTLTSGSAGFDGVLVSTNSATNGSGSGTPAWAGFDVAGKNKIINGGFDFWQRGTSFSSAGTPYTADRWWLSSDLTGTRTISQQTFTPGAAPVAGYEAPYFLRFAQTTTGTGSYGGLSTKIEDVRTFANQTVTLSFFAKADAARTITPSLIQNFGSGGSGNVNAASTTFNLGTSWTRYSVTWNLPPISAKTVGTGSWLELYIGLPVNTVQTIDIWGVQLEAGSVATPFSRAGGTIQGELAACQRYLSKIGGDVLYSTIGLGSASSTTLAKIYMKHPITLRTPPTSPEWSTICLFDGVGAIIPVTALTLNTGQSGNDTAYLEVTVASGLTQYRNYWLITNNSLSGYVRLPAEL
jgi:hypothetical protein